MYQLTPRGPVAYEDLMRQLAVIESRLLPQDSSLAMELMVLETKLRERFQRLESQLRRKFQLEEDVNQDVDAVIQDINDLIPRDIPPFPTLGDLQANRKTKRILKTIGTAASLAVFTALGVFGLAWVLQWALSWLG